MKKYLLACIIFILSINTHANDGVDTNKTISAVILQHLGELPHKNAMVCINGFEFRPFKNVKHWRVDARNILTVTRIPKAVARSAFGEQGKDGAVNIIRDGSTSPFAFYPSFFQGTNISIRETRTSKKLDEEASFPGREPGWRKYFNKNHNPNVPSGHPIPGTYTAVIRFTIEKDSTVRNMTTLTNHGYGIETEAMRLIKDGPKWHPAVYKNQNIRSTYTQPVTFVVTLNFALSQYRFPPGEETSFTISNLPLKPDEIEVEISNGTLKHVSGFNYTLLVDNPGKTLLTVWKKDKEKKRRVDAVELVVE